MPGARGGNMYENSQSYRELAELKPRSGIELVYRRSYATEIIGGIFIFAGIVGALIFTFCFGG